jgi:hypothetical protein
LKLFGKSGWRKVIVHLAVAEWKEFDCAVWTMVDDAADMLHAPLFFSRYSDAASGQRVEIQIQTDQPDEKLWTFFTAYGPHVLKVEFAATDGSDVYAAAYALSRKLRGKGEPLTKDVLHFTLNMTGYSYAQEVRLLAEEVAAMAANMEKLA